MGGLEKAAFSGKDFNYNLPSVLESILTAQSLVDVDAHETPNEFLGFVADVVPVGRVELELAFEDLREEIRVVLVVERRVAAKQDVADDADRPDVHRLAVGLLRQHLGRHVARRAARRSHDARIFHLGEAEVADHNLGVFVLALIEQILWLEIAMDDTFAVHVGDGVENLANQVGSVFLRVRAFLHDAVEEFAARDPKEKKDQVISKAYLPKGFVTKVRS